MIPEPPAGSVVTWFQQFHAHERMYQFVALHVPGRGWYLTGRTQTPVAWPEVLRFAGAATHIYVACTWQPLAPAQPQIDRGNACNYP